MIAARLAREESGFGVVEVLVAAVVLAVGILATVGALDGASKASYGAQRHEQAISLAQREIERIAAYPFARVELDAAPTATSDADPNNPTDPRAYVVAGGNYLIKRNYNNSAAGAPPDNADREPFVVDPDADPVADGYSIPAVSLNVPVGAVSATGIQAEATVWRFVTRRKEGCRLTSLPLVDLCPGAQGARRVVVAVAFEPVGGEAASPKPIYLTSLVGDPTVAPLDLPL